MEGTAFVGREAESEVLGNLYRNEAHPLVAVVGRTGIGKTELVHRFAGGMDHFYYAPGPDHGLEAFSERVRAFAGGSGAYGDWGQALAALAAGGPRRVVVIDGFDAMCAGCPGFREAFASAWESSLSKADLMVVAIGGSAAESMFSGGGSLAGIATAVIRLEPIPFTRTVAGRDYRRAVEEYAFTGGVPRYMAMMDPGRSVVENVSAALRASDGADALAALADSAGDVTDGRSPAERLLDGGLVETVVPVTGEDAENGGTPRHSMGDGMVRLALSPAAGDLEGRYVQDHVVPAFRDVCMEELGLYLASRGEAADIGAYWDSVREIPVAALTDSAVYAGDCAFSDAPVGADAVRSIASRAGEVPAFAGRRVVPCMFSVSGYTDDAVAEAEASGAVLFDCGRPLRGRSP